MSGAFSFRAPSNPGLEKLNIHIPPKLKQSIMHDSSMNNYMNKYRLHSANSYISTSMDVFSNECKNDFENFYRTKIQSKWTDENQNLKVWEYQSKKEGNLGDFIDM